MADKDIVMLAKSYNDQDPTGWWISEKLDGMRLLWDGHTAISRNGKPIILPASFQQQLPVGLSLDGELFLGHGRFQETMSIVRRKVPDQRWDQIQYRVFDSPNTTGGFETRLAEVKGHLFWNRKYQPAPQIRVQEQILCASLEHMKMIFADLVANGAEGIMLRRFGSDYELKRSDSLLKYKPWLHSIDARVMGHQSGNGKHINRLGALVCLFLPGQQELDRAALTFKIPVNYLETFTVGTGFTDQDRENPPPIGSIIRMSCQSLTDAGLPRFPVFEHIRDFYAINS